MSYESLFQPIKINGVEIKNRIVMSPMLLNDAYPAGYVSEQSKALFAARAKGGVGLVILGGTAHTKWAWETATYSNSFRMDIDDTLSGFSELVDRVHAFDAKIFCQLMQSFGRVGSSKRYGVQPESCTAEPLVAAEDAFPEGLRIPGGHAWEIPRELPTSEIIEIEDASADSATRIVAAGFDGMEIACHLSYLAASFLSPLVNKRTDLYGGSFQNRMRFLLNTVRKIRDKIGPDFPMGIKLICNEHVEGGLTAEESAEIAKVLEKEGMGYVALADGCYQSLKFANPAEDGTLLKHGELQAFKKKLKIPIMAHSYHDPDIAEKVVAERKTDMVVLGRQLLADPDWANKVKDGKVSEITRCDRDNFCLLRLFLGLPVRCKLNPNLGRERYMPEYWQPPYQY